MKKLVERIAAWIASAVKDAGLQGAVVGLSGGVDSAVVAALCREALGDRVLGVLMPCESDPRDGEDALLVANTLGIETTTVRLDEVYQALARALPKPPTGLAAANLKPRLRMTTLYCFANQRSYIVAGTGNKSELMAGYFTKYGDGSADILPLGELYKTDVRKLARELGIPAPVLEKAPSAGLWKGQTDEEEMGISYEELDRALQSIESGRDSNVPVAIIEQVTLRIVASEHKRSPARVFKV